MTPHAQGLLDIGKLALDFAKVKRVTLHEDGETFESDTDHTVMLSLCACALAQKMYPNLDIGKVAQFSIVHDLVEVYAGDTNTINISKEDRDEKEKREAKSLLRIKKEFHSVYPWIDMTIEEYENRQIPEARFVKTLDKAMSKITNTLNKGASLRKLGATRKEIERHFRVQTDEYRQKYGSEFPELIDLLEELMQNMLQEIHV